MRVKNSAVFLLLFLFVFHTIFFAARSSGCHIRSINESAIETKISEIKKSLKVNTALRYTILGAGTTAGVAATAYTLYDWFGAKNCITDVQVAVGKVLPCVDSTLVALGVLKAALQPIIDCMKNLKERVEGVEGAQQKIQDKKWSGLFQFGKRFIAFGLHSVGSVLMWNFVTNAQHYCRTIFKSRDLKWFIAMQTHLGSFIEYEDMEGFSNERFNEGTLLRELKGIAKLFDEEVSGDANKIDLLSQMLWSVSESLIDEVTVVVAFMQHFVTTALIPVFHEDVAMAAKESEAISYSHFLCSHANAFAHSVEQIIEKKLSISLEKTDSQTIVQKFIADFTNMLVGFNRIMIKYKITL